MDAFWPTSFQKPNSMTSKLMLEILEDAIANMKDSEEQSERGGVITNMKDLEEQLESGGVDTSVSRSYTILNSKRNRQGQDVVVVSKRMKTSRNTMLVQDYGIWKESVMVPDSDAMRSVSSTSFTTSL